MVHFTKFIGGYGGEQKSTEGGGGVVQPGRSDRMKRTKTSTQETYWAGDSIWVYSMS